MIQAIKKPASSDVKNVDELKKEFASCIAAMQDILDKFDFYDQRTWDIQQRSKKPQKK